MFKNTLEGEKELKHVKKLFRKHPDQTIPASWYILYRRTDTPNLTVHFSFRTGLHRDFEISFVLPTQN